MSRSQAFNPTPAESLATTRIKYRAQPRSLKTIDAKKPPLELTAAGLEEWKKIAPQLSEAGLAAVIDANLLAVYCEVRARWVQAEKMVTELGTVVASSTQTPATNPYLKIADAAIRQLAELGRELGLSPAARDELRRKK